MSTDQMLKANRSNVFENSWIEPDMVAFNFSNDKKFYYDPMQSHSNENADNTLDIIAEQDFVAEMKTWEAASEEDSFQL